MRYDDNTSIGCRSSPAKRQHISGWTTRDNTISWRWLNDKRTCICVALHPVSILHARRPSTLVLSARVRTLSHPVASLEALRPLATVDPSSLRLDAEPVSFALRPRSFKRIATRPRVDAADFETRVPRPRVFTLSFRSRADTMSVRLAVFPPAAVRATVVEIKASSPGHYPTACLELPDSTVVHSKLGVCSDVRKCLWLAAFVPV